MRVLNRRNVTYITSRTTPCQTPQHSPELKGFYGPIPLTVLILLVSRTVPNSP